MRIIAGTARGRRISGPKDDRTRPMTDRAKEALFSILGTRVRDAVVLDLYAGTGALGLEALSRGATRVTFVESDRAALTVLEANIAHVGLGGEVVGSTVERHLAKPPGGDVDLAFVDPPYPLELPSVQTVLTTLAPHLAPDATIVVHRRVGEVVPEAPWPLVDERRYGTTRLWLYRVPT